MELYISEVRDGQDPSRPLFVKYWVRPAGSRGRWIPYHGTWHKERDNNCHVQTDNKARINLGIKRGPWWNSQQNRLVDEIYPAGSNPEHVLEVNTVFEDFCTNKERFLGVPNFKSPRPIDGDPHPVTGAGKSQKRRLKNKRTRRNRV